MSGQFVAKSRMSSRWLFGFVGTVGVDARMHNPAANLTQIDQIWKHRTTGIDNGCSSLW